MGVQLFSFTPDWPFLSASPCTEFFQKSFCKHLVFAPPQTVGHQITTLRTCLCFTDNNTTSTLNCNIVSEQNHSFWSRQGHLPPPFLAVHLLAVVSIDVEWCPNPLKEHVGTVCISFSHLRERPQPSLFSGIPCPLSVQLQPQPLA